MLVPKTLFVCICVVGVALIGWGQHRTDAIPANGNHGIPGFLDPQHGTFTTRVQSPSTEGEPTPTVTEVAGTFNINLSITVSSPFPSGAVIACFGSVSVYNDSNSSVEEDAQAVGSAPKSGSSTCNLSMPYAWFLSSASTDTLYYSYRAEIVQNIPIGSAPNVTYSRYSYVSPNGGMPVPANGAITTIAAVMRL